jgi:hypothetical protein
VNRRVICIGSVSASSKSAARKTEPASDSLDERPSIERSAAPPPQLPVIIPWPDIFRGALLALGNNEYSYGELAGGEYVVHEIGINLNEIGERWAATLQVLEEAEIISVDMSPHWIDVAPWHARDV